MNLFHEGNITLQYEWNASGTASSEMMDILGLGTPEKRVLITMLPKPFADRMGRKLKEMCIRDSRLLDGQGIQSVKGAQMDGIPGVSLMNFFTDVGQGGAGNVVFGRFHRGLAVDPGGEKHDAQGRHCEHKEQGSRKQKINGVFLMSLCWHAHRSFQ